MSSLVPRSPETTTETVTVEIGDYASAPFEFRFHSDGSGTCKDIEEGAEVPFKWDPAILDDFREQERTEALADHARELFWDAINGELDDPVLTEDDYGGEEAVFATGSSEALERCIQLILYSFPHIWDDDRDEIEITIQSSTEEEKASVDDYCAFAEDGEISEEDKQRIRSLVEYALDVNEPTGFSLEYNDGAQGRSSGYYASPNSVSYSIPKPSFHELAVARDELFAVFGKELTDEIAGYLPEETDDGQCSVPQ